MDFLVGAIAICLMVRGAVAAWHDVARSAPRAGRAVWSAIRYAARAVVADWRGWRSMRERKTARRREGRERLLIEALRESVGVNASQREEIAMLRERLESTAGQATSMPAARSSSSRPFAGGS